MKKVLKQLQLFYGDIARDIRIEDGEVILEISNRTIKVELTFRGFRVTLNGGYAKVVKVPSEVVDLVEEYIDMEIEVEEKEENTEMVRVRKNSITARLRVGDKFGVPYTVRVGLVPCKANLNSAWISPVWVTVSSIEEFEKAVNEFTYYNCNNTVGTYPHYYIAK